MKYFFSYAIFLLFLVKSGHLLNCMSCRSGYDVPDQLCSDVRPAGMSVICTGVNAQCYEAIVWYQKGALRLVQRDCWVPPTSNTRLTWCDSFTRNSSSHVGVIQKCRVCYGSLCNNKRLVEEEDCSADDHQWF